MYTHPARALGKRSAFTLIEMFVVLAIILALAVLTVLFMPRFQERQRVSRGADLLQEWLLMAKMRALRDRVPTGVRVQVVLVEQPDRTLSVGRQLQYIRKT